ncbi:MAG: TonB-dependent receptor [bacterium]|nr:TonB-dependent receptor [bacterium]
MPPPVHRPLSLTRAVLASLLAFFVAGIVSARTGGIEILAIDAATGEPLAGATVTLQNEFGFVAATAARTDVAGRVIFPVLRAGGGYRALVAMPGFATQAVGDLRVSTDEREHLTVSMLPELSERVKVTGRRDIVELDQTAATTTLSDLFLENLPIPGRFYQNTLTLAPGVKDADEDGNPNVHGARFRDFKALVGGVSNVDPLTGEWLSYVHPESIEELQIITGGAGVEFGRAQGGFARIVQKQGGNEHEGVAAFIFRSSELDRTGAASPSVVGDPDFSWIQPSLQLSGPIVRDRLWYRASHEYIKREDPVNLLTSLAVITRTQGIHSDQITFQLSPRNKLALQFQSDPLTLENVDVSTFRPPESTHTHERGGQTYTLTWTAPVSTRLLVESIVAYQDSGNDFIPTDPTARSTCVEYDRFAVLQDTVCDNVTLGTISGAFPETWRDDRQRLTIRTQADIYTGRFLGASHRIKTGFIVENERFYRDLERRPSVTFEVSDGLFGPPVGLATARTSVPVANDDRATGTSWGVFLEDRFRPVDTVSVTLGLRFDREEIAAPGFGEFDTEAETAQFFALWAQGIRPYNIVPRAFTAFPAINEFQQHLGDVLGVRAVFLPLGPTAVQSAFWRKKQSVESIHYANNYFSPRVSVAWDPWGNGRTKFSASAGRYYDKLFLGVPLIEMEPPFTDVTIVAQADGTTGRYAEHRLFEGVGTGVSVQWVDRDLSAPYQDELQLSFERSLWPESSIRLSYMRRSFRDQLQDVDQNHVQADRGRCLRPPRGIGTYAVYPSYGEGRERIDYFTGEVYIDTDPGPGDGRIDDCTGGVIPGVGLLGRDQARPDGLPDLYVQNPGWADILLVGNFNEADYEAYVVEFVRRQYRGWQMNASYTWSEAYGQAEDFAQVLGNERTLIDDEEGYLSYDQRHDLKLTAISITPWGFRFGGSLRWQSGLPFSFEQNLLTVYAVPWEYQNQGDVELRRRIRYPTRQRNDQRNPSFWNLDLRLAREFALRGASLQLTVEMFNVFNDDTLVLSRSINGSNEGIRRFGRQFQVGMRVAF